MVKKSDFSSRYPLMGRLEKCLHDNNEITETSIATQWYWYWKVFCFSFQGLLSATAAGLLFFCSDLSPPEVLFLLLSRHQRYPLGFVLCIKPSVNFLLPPFLFSVSVVFPWLIILGAVTTVASISGCHLPDHLDYDLWYQMAQQQYTAPADNKRW